MSRRTQENIIAGTILCLFIGVIVMSLGYGPRARMIPLPLATFGIILIVIQIIWQNVRSTDELQMDMLQMLTRRAETESAAAEGGERGAGRPRFAAERSAEMSVTTLDQTTNQTIPRERAGGVWDYVSASRLNLWLRCPLAFKLRYIDGVSSLWCNVHGHQVPELDAALREQLDHRGRRGEPGDLLAAGGARGQVGLERLALGAVQRVQRVGAGQRVDVGAGHACTPMASRRRMSPSRRRVKPLKVTPSEPKIQSTGIG